MSFLVLAPEHPSQSWYDALSAIRGHGKIHIIDDFAQEPVRAFARKNNAFYLAHKRQAGLLEAFKSALRTVQGDGFSLLVDHNISDSGDLVELTKSNVIGNLRHADPALKIETIDQLLDLIQTPPSVKVQTSDYFDLLFFPMSAYHAWTISLLAPKMEASNLRYKVVDLSIHRDDFGLADAIQKHNLPRLSLSDFILFTPNVSSLVVFNDWDPTTRPMLNLANKIGIGTIGIVEGIQDYLDVDTARDRFAYRTVKNLCFSGEFDKKYFTDHMPHSCILGVPRVLEMRKKNPISSAKSEKPIALINSNFSYGVLTEHRDRWVNEAVSSAQKAGYAPVISRHPGDKGTLFPELVSKNSFYEELARADRTIQRFASGILESLAWQVPVVYFNPKIEKVDKFMEPLGAYEVATSDRELVACLKNPTFDKTAADDFLDFHSGRADLNTGEVFVDFVSPICAEIQPNNSHMARFYVGMEKLEKATNFYTSRPPALSLYDIELEKLEHRENNQQVTKTYYISKKLFNVLNRTPLRRLVPTSLLKKLKNIIYRL